MDAEVAELVFGAQIHDGQYEVYWTLPGDRPISDQRPLPAFSTEIAAAWIVVEKMRVGPPRFANLSLVGYCYNRTYATFDAEALCDYSPETWVEANGAHATPLAICLAALSAVSAPRP